MAGGSEWLEAASPPSRGAGLGHLHQGPGQVVLPTNRPPCLEVPKGRLSCCRSQAPTGDNCCKKGKPSQLAWVCRTPVAGPETGVAIMSVEGPMRLLWPPLPAPPGAQPPPSLPQISREPEATAAWSVRQAATHQGPDPAAPVCPRECRPGRGWALHCPPVSLRAGGLAPCCPPSMCPPPHGASSPDHFNSCPSLVTCPVWNTAPFLLHKERLLSLPSSAGR